MMRVQKRMISGDRRTLGTVTALTALALFVVACGDQGNVEEIEFRVPVAVQDVAKGNVEDLILATGNLRTVENVVLRTETAGFLTLAQANGKRLAEGDRVRAGQVLAEVTGEDVRLASAEEARRKRFDAAERSLAARRELFKDGIIPEEQVRDAETMVAEARLELDRSQLTVNRTQIATPIDGVILRLAREAGSDLPLADGQRVDNGFTVAQIAPTAALIADVDLVGLDLGRVREGLEARLRHYAWENLFDGRLVRLAPSIDPITRTIRGEVVVDNKDGRLRPGMFVEVTLVAESRQDVVVVPREAVTERGGKRVVFVLNGQRAARRDVVLGLGDDDVVEVRQGLDVEDRLIVRGLETLTDGSPVRVTG